MAGPESSAQASRGEPPFVATTIETGERQGGGPVHPHDNRDGEAPSSAEDETAEARLEVGQAARQAGPPGDRAPAEDSNTEGGGSETATHWYQQRGEEMGGLSQAQPQVREHDGCVQAAELTHTHIGSVGSGEQGNRAHSSLSPNSRGIDDATASLIQGLAQQLAQQQQQLKQLFALISRERTPAAASSEREGQDRASEVLSPSPTRETRETPSPSTTRQ